MNFREVMTISEAADYLGISQDTLYAYAGEGALPAFKLGNRWRFRKVRLDEWMDRQASTRTKGGRGESSEPLSTGGVVKPPTQ